MSDEKLIQNVFKDKRLPAKYQEKIAPMQIMKFINDSSRQEMLIRLGAELRKA